jgi:hypothetical protein
MFAKATKKKQRARVALMGPPGSGKTYTALTIGKELGGRIAVIDTERGSASKYSGDVAEFDVAELDGTYSPKAYVAAIRAAADAGYDVLVIDSLSHAWEGAGGILSQVDQKGGRFDAWKDMDPQLRGLIDAILTYPGHVIATLRVATDWVVEQVERKGRMTSEPRKVGLKPKFKDGLEYEFDVVGILDDHNVLTVTKSRCSALAGEVVAKPGKAFADALKMWLEDGESAETLTASVARVLGLYQAATSSAARHEARAALTPLWPRLSHDQRVAMQSAMDESAARVKATEPTRDER